MKKRMLLSILTIGVVGALVAGAVTAYFTDTETTLENQFQAGTIDFEITESASLPFVLEDMKPCDWEEVTIQLHNIGTNAGPLYL
ncbi:MAG: TasA family protein, partial [Dehalococcoidia bacterium]